MLLPFYKITALLDTLAQYMILLGQRANGKSFQVKETVLSHYYKTGEKFIYLRRWKSDIKTVAVESYFEDMDISALTNGEWTNVVAYRQELYFARYKDNTMEKSDVIGRYCALNEAERYKSWVFKNYAFIAFEEFITDGIYLDDEPFKLEQFVSTVARNNNIRVFMIGNTLTRVCPYFSKWCLTNVLNQKPGTIDIYHHQYEDYVVDIAVEYCAATSVKSKMFFGNSAKQIIGGEWETKEYPRLPLLYYEYDELHKVIFNIEGFTFMMKLLLDPMHETFVMYVYPYTKEITDSDRVIQPSYSPLLNVSRTLNNDNKFEALMMRCLQRGDVCYSDNLTATDFNNVLKSYNKRGY